MVTRNSLIRLIVALFVLWVAPAQASTTAAVMPLGKGAGPAEFDGLGRALADMMVTDLSSSKTLQLVERTKLKLVLDELKLAKSGFLDKRTAQKLGRGLGAQLVITGSFSVVGKKFVMDIRIVDVKTGAILKAARSDGPIDDFIAIEKDVVEKLLSGLEVKLTPGARRKLLLATPTESATALASYGRGLEATDAGLVKQARAAYEEALRLDPDFAKASLALRDLATMAEAASQSEQELYKESVARSLQAGLRAIPAETSRKKNFKDTRDTLMDFTIRMYLLEVANKHCARYAELKHFLFRKNGDFEGWFIGLKSNYQDSWKEGKKRIAERAKQLGLAGRDKVFDSNARGLMFEASPDLMSGNAILLGHSLSPEVFGTLLNSMERCYTPNVQIAEFDALLRRVLKFKWINKSLATTVNIGPSTVTARDSLDLYWAYLRALHRGVDAKVKSRSDAVLARHPEGDPNRRDIVSRIKKIVSAGKSYQTRVASRMKLSEKAILRYARAAQSGDAKVVHTTNLNCQQALKSGSYQIDHSLKSYDKMHARTSKSNRSSTLNRLANSIATLEMAGCFRRGKAKPLSNQQIITKVKAGLRRPNPAKLEDKRCLADSQAVRKELGKITPASPLSSVVDLLRRLHHLRTDRCMLP